MIRARPLHDRIVVRRDSPALQSKGGVYFPPSSQEQKRAGEVLAIGPGIMGPHGDYIPMTVQIGDKVIFGSYAGTEIEIDGEKYQIMREGDVVCVVDPAAEITTAALGTPRHEVAGHYK